MLPSRFSPWIWRKQAPQNVRTWLFTSRHFVTSQKTWIFISTGCENHTSRNIQVCLLPAAIYIRLLLILSDRDNQSCSASRFCNLRFFNVNDCYNYCPHKVSDLSHFPALPNISLRYFIFIIPCIVIFYGMTNRCNNVQWDLFLCKSTLHVSGDTHAHHQEYRSNCIDSHWYNYWSGSDRPGYCLPV